MNRTITTAFMLVGLAPLAIAQTPAPGVRLPPYKEIRLPNGAQILLMEKHDVPIVAFTAGLRGGAVADEPGKEGTGSLVAALLLKGAGTRNAQQFSQAVDSVGGRIEAFPRREMTIVTGDFMARDTDLMIELLRDLIRQPQFKQEEFDKVRTRSIEEIGAAKDSDPNSLMSLYFGGLLFGSHPYGRPAGGSETTLAKITRDDVLQYYKKHLGADRMILSVVGDFRSDEIEKKLRSAFGNWNKAAAPAPVSTAFTPAKGRRVLLVDKPDATQTYFWLGNVGIARNDPDRVVVDLINTAFGGRFTSMLNSELRVKTGLTYGARSNLARETVPGPLAIGSYTKTETTEKAIDLALDILTRLRKESINDEMISSVKSYVLGQFPPTLETAAQLSSRLTDLAFYGMNADEVNQYAERIGKASPADIKRVVARVYPDPANLTMVLVGNAEAIRAIAKKYGPVTEMKITDKSFSAGR